MFTTFLVVAALAQVPAQNVRPQIGYVYPPGGRAGSTIDVKLGVYDWTPDTEIMVRDERVKIEVVGPASEMILTPPPYWFGGKAGQAQPPLPREIPARITLPADLPPGEVQWQLASANGTSDMGTFVVSDRVEVVEPESHHDEISLPSLPVVASGRISRITERDVYRFKPSTTGLVTCRLDSRPGQNFSGVVTVRDSQGKLVADSADTLGIGATAMFVASAGGDYNVTINDLEFGGDRGYVYRLTIEPGPQLVATLPVVVERGKTTAVEFIGWGVASGSRRLESITQDVSIPADAPDRYRHVLKTAAGALVATLRVVDAGDAVEPLATETEARTVDVPAQISGRLDRLDPASGVAVDKYRLTAKKGTALRIVAESGRTGSPVDPSLTIVDGAGKVVLQNDDVPGSTDAAIDFRAPADGDYEIVVSDFSGTTPSRAHTYRLLVDEQSSASDLTLTVPDRFDVAIGDKADLLVKVARVGGWKGPVTVRLEGLPQGVAPAAELTIADPKTDLKASIAADEQIGTGASFFTVVASAKIGDRQVERRSQPVLLAVKLKTRCVVKSAVQDGGRIVNRGTTYPADVVIDRLEGYDGPVTLQMAAAQQRQRRGIASPAIVVPQGVDRVQMPVFLPEWLETSLTCRMALIGVVQVADPKGRVRHVTGVMDGQIVMSIEGGLLKASHEPAERVVEPGGTIEIPIKVSRTARLRSPANVELVADERLPTLFSADSVTVPVEGSIATMRVRVANDPAATGMRALVFRATALQDGRWPAVSETTVPVIVNAAGSVAQ